MTRAKTYDAFKAFLSGAGKNVDVIENVDIGAGYRGARDQGRAAAPARRSASAGT